MGSEMCIRDSEDSKAFVYSKVSAYKQLYLFEKGFHELQHDVEKDELLEAAAKFLDSLPRKSPFGKLNILPIETKVKTDYRKLYVLLAVIIFLIGLRVKNGSVLKGLQSLMEKVKRILLCRKL